MCLFKIHLWHIWLLENQSGDFTEKEVARGMTTACFVAHSFGKMQVVLGLELMSCNAVNWVTA